jgi:hypothetical protein
LDREPLITSDSSIRPREQRAPVPDVAWLDQKMRLGFLRSEVAQLTINLEWRNSWGWTFVRAADDTPGGQINTAPLIAGDQRHGPEGAADS